MVFGHVVQPYSHNHSCSGIPPLWILFFVFLFCLLSKRPPLPTTVRCLTPCHSYDLISPLTSPISYIHPCSAVCWPHPVACLACLNCKTFLLFCLIFACVCTFLYVNLTLPDSPSNVLTETEEGEIVRSALRSNGSVNKITESLNNASGCPFPSSEGKFGPITLALRRLIF